MRQNGRCRSRPAPEARKVPRCTQARVQLRGKKPGPVHYRTGKHVRSHKRQSADPQLLWGEPACKTVHKVGSARPAHTNQRHMHASLVHVGSRHAVLNQHLHKLYIHIVTDHHAKLTQLFVAYRHSTTAARRLSTPRIARCVLGGMRRACTTFGRIANELRAHTVLCAKASKQHTTGACAR